MNGIIDNDFVIRYGGDEFLVILRNCSEETRQEIMKRIVKSSEVHSDFILRISFCMARYNDSLEKTIIEAEKNV